MRRYDYRIYPNCANISTLVYVLSARLALVSKEHSQIPFPFYRLLRRNTLFHAAFLQAFVRRFPSPAAKIPQNPVISFFEFVEYNISMVIIRSFTRTCRHRASYMFPRDTKLPTLPVYSFQTSVFSMSIEQSILSRLAYDCRLLWRPLNASTLVHRCT